MATLNIKEFNTMVEKLEKMADGVKSHGQEAGFPAILSEADLRALKTELEDRRQAYENAENNARLIYDDYKKALLELKQKYINFATMLYGFYGKKNQVVVDFGLLPHKTSGRRGPRKPIPETVI